MAEEKKNPEPLPTKTYWHLYSLQNLQSDKLVRIVNKVLKQEFRAGHGTGGAVERQTCQRVPLGCLGLVDRITHGALGNKRASWDIIRGPFGVPMKISIEYCQA